MTFTNRKLAALAFCGAIATTGAFAQDTMEHGKMMGGKMKGGKMAMTMDSRFAMEAASGGMTEVALGKMAAEKGGSQAVKDFGQKMVDDHGKANEELKTLCTAKNMMMPTAPNAKDQAAIDKMSGLSGAAFDKAYIKDMVMDHKHDVMAFTKESNSGMDADVKAFAAKTLPTLKEHQKMINDIAAKKM
jgi:putative membrane protein